MPTLGYWKIRGVSITSTHVYNMQYALLSGYVTAFRSIKGKNRSMQGHIIINDILKVKTPLFTKQNSVVNFKITHSATMTSLLR